VLHDHGNAVAFFIGLPEKLSFSDLFHRLLAKLFVVQKLTLSAFEK
jgi:hypothetical protein